MTDSATDLLLRWQEEQRRRWEAGDRIRLEHFLEQHREIAAHESSLLSLIYQEFRLRESLGDAPDPAEYVQRFPEYVEQLHSLFSLHAASESVGDVTAERAVKQAVHTVDFSPAGDAPPNSEDDGDFGLLTTYPLGQGARVSAGLRFHVLRPHARGGLGEVFLAFDEELNREVALKQIHARYADNSERRVRFVSEAEITGGLEHPGIVPVYGLGTYSNGRPFYAMRFIRGECLKSAIEHYHASNSVSTERVLEFRKLLARMIDVCDAMEYAHARGVLHRDLKPANIMVGKFGETLIVDWGLAKATGNPQAPTVTLERPLELSSRSSFDETHLGSAIGTPQYMSPEQAAGRTDLITTASDVYGLGSTLYHVLTGKAPLEGTNLGSVLEHAQTGRFASPRTVKPEIPSALESICLKAMSLQPADRYHSARTLADDIEHWLADEPVLAHPESLLTRAGRWMRKHRSWTRAAAVSLLTVSLVSLVAAILVNQSRRNEAVQRHVAQAARQEAVEHFRQARESMDTWLTGAGEAMKYYPHMQQIRRRLLEQAATSYQQLNVRRNDADLELERGRAQLRLGDVHRILGNSPASEKDYRGAQKIFDDLIAEGREPNQAEVEKANAGVRLALLLADTERREAADEEYQKTIVRLKSVVPDQLGERGHETLGTALFNRAALQLERGDHAQAIESLRESLEEFSAAWPLKTGVPRARFAAASAKNLWGQCLVDAGRYDAATQKFQDALAELADLTREGVDEPEYLEAQAAIYGNLSPVLHQSGKYAEELDCYRRAVVDFQALDQALPHAPTVVEGLALTRTNMAQLLHRLGESSAALAEVEQVLPVFRELQATYPHDPDFREEEGAAEDIAGQSLSDLARDEASQTAYQRAIQIFSELAKTSPDVLAYQRREAVCRSHLGQAFAKSGMRNEAEEHLRAAIASLDRISNDLPEVVDDACLARTHLARLLFDAGDKDAAAATFSQADADWSQLVARIDSPEFKNHLAWQLVNCADPAARNAARAATLAEEGVKAAPANAYYLTTLAVARYRQGDFAEAVSQFKRVREIRPDPDGRAGFFLAMALAKTGAQAEALEAIAAARSWTRDHVPGNPELSRIEAEAAATLQNP